MINEPTFTAYITKYALTAGIQRICARVVERTAPAMIEHVGNRVPTYYHGEGVEWHRTWKDAQIRAYVMREKKLASLIKQHERLQRTFFEVEPE